MIEPKIAILIPCFNEGLTIKTVVEDFKKELPLSKIYVYDNNSTDNTYEIAKETGAIVNREFDQGKGAVVRSMFNAIEADIYVMVDGDDTYPAKEIHRLLKVFKDRNADLVMGDRLSNHSYFKKNKRAFHGFGNILVRKCINIIFKARLNDIMTGYRVFSKRFVKTYPVLYQGFEIETDMTIFALHNRLNLVEEPIVFKNRPEGSVSKLNTYKDGFKVLLTIFNLFRFYKPLTFFGLNAFLLFIAGVIVGTPVLDEYIQFRYIYKVPSAILAVGLMLFSLLLFVCGLILEAFVIAERKKIELHLK